MYSLTIRRATPADRQSVLDIRDDVYAGRDYLPYYYDCFMKSKACISFVAEIEGKVIAFSTGFLVDDGRTVVTRAARTSPRYSGIGIFTMINCRIFEESGAKVNASLLDESNPAILKDSFRREHRLVASRPLCRFNIGTEDIKLPNEVVNIPTVDAEHLTQYLTDDTYRKYLFPAERMAVSWFPLQLKTSNINLLREIGYQLTAISNLRIVDDRVQGVLVFYSMYSCNDTDYYDVDVYGTDVPAFREAMVFVLSNITHTKSEYIDILVVYEETIDEGYVEGMMKEFGLRKMRSCDAQYSVQLTYEKDIK